jgi:hypothetical protein
MMRTRGGVRIIARGGREDDGTPSVVMLASSIGTVMTLDESHQLRGLLQAAELDAARGNVIT